MLEALRLPPHPRSSVQSDAVESTAYMGDPGRIVRVEWRKMRRSESNGMTSHSWLEAYLRSGSRLKMETYGNIGYTESLRAASDPLEGTLYEGRSAEMQDINCHLTIDELREIGRSIGGRRPYSLSEFNCHHFALEVWNSITVERLRATHYPDRTKVNLLWGLEGAGSWLDGLRTTSSGAIHTQGAANGFGGKVYDAQPREEAGYNVAFRRKHFEEAIANGLVFQLDPRSSELTAISLPPSSKNCNSTNVEAWAEANFPGAKYAAIQLAERIGPLDLSMLASELSVDNPPVVNNAGNDSPFAFLRSMASMASISSVSPGSRQRVTYYPYDVCFIVLRGEELRLVVYGILQSMDDPSKTSILRMLSGNALLNEEASFRYSMLDAPKGIGSISACEIADEDLPHLQVAVRTNDFEALLAHIQRHS